MIMTYFALFPKNLKLFLPSVYAKWHTRIVKAYKTKYKIAWDRSL